MKVYEQTTDVMWWQQPTWPKNIKSRKGTISTNITKTEIDRNIWYYITIVRPPDTANLF
jgi:hypothetical protein